MEKRLQKDSILKIVITGPESTGKSTLSEQLAKHYNTVFIPEYARSYVENLNRPYTYADVEHIAHQQVEDIQVYERKANKILFLDTYLIITKVWFEVVFQRCPEWVIGAIHQSHIDLFLLCSTDLPWEPDNVRENGGEMREKLYHIYKQELEKFNFTVEVIGGIGNQRLANAVNAIDHYFEQIK
jgi:NadR type nicotinamide-nucleotide adenylyltransferase